MKIEVCFDGVWMSRNSAANELREREGISKRELIVWRSAGAAKLKAVWGSRRDPEYSEGFPFREVED